MISVDCFQHIDCAFFRRSGLAVALAFVHLILDDTLLSETISFKLKPCVLDKISSSVVMQICKCSSLTLIAFMNEEHSDLQIDFGGMLALYAICMIIAVSCFAQL